MSFDTIMSECAPLAAKQKDGKSKKEEKYNIYKILHVTNNEVLMCRVLTDLLSPRGVHGMGSVYLKDFLMNVLDMDVPDSILQEAHVYKEYPITNDRRIDIVIRFQSSFIPIEVKINAGEQKSQCYDYYEYAKKRDADTFVVYLTKYGHYPSTYSTSGAKGLMVPTEKIRCISFCDDIIEWIQRIEKVSQNSMKEMLEQYAGAIKDFTENDDEEYIMELAEKICENSDNLRTSIGISKAINEAKAKTMYTLFEELEKQMEPLLETYGLEEETRSCWFHYREQANSDFYAHNDSTYPGINYIVKRADMGDGLSLWLRIEVEYRLFAGFCLFNYNLDSEFGVGNQQDIISDEMWENLKKYLSLPEKQEEKSWIVDWIYLPTGSSSTLDDIDSVPDFKAMNEAAVVLADQDIREIFVKRCVAAIEEALLSALK